MLKSYNIVIQNYTAKIWNTSENSWWVKIYYASNGEVYETDKCEYKFENSAQNFAKLWINKEIRDNQST